MRGRTGADPCPGGRGRCGIFSGADDRRGRGATVRQGSAPRRRAGLRAPRTPGTSVTVVLGALALVGLVGGLLAAPAAATNRTTSRATSTTVWLCRPGQADDPCTSDLSSTTVTADGSTQEVAASASTSSKFDCFYVYPTVSAQTTPNANLEVEATETVTAEDQAARFSQVCRVWAPMYRQRTVASLDKNQPGANQVAYASLLVGWKDYLARDNHGRPIIFIGHSQGAAMLIRLL